MGWFLQPGKCWVAAFFILEADNSVVLLLVCLVSELKINYALQVY